MFRLSSPWRSVDLIHRVAGDFLNGVRHEVARELLDLALVEALLDQLAFGAEHVMEAIGRILDLAGMARDPELFRRH